MGNFNLFKENLLWLCNSSSFPSHPAGKLVSSPRHQPAVITWIKNLLTWYLDSGKKQQNFSTNQTAMTRAKFLPWISNNHQKGIRPNLSLITKRKGKSSSSDCRMVPKDRLKCPDAFRGWQETLHSLLSSWWADPKGLWHSHMSDPLHLPKAELSQETGEELDKTQVIIFYSLLRQNTDLQSSVAWKTKTRVKSKFFCSFKMLLAKLELSLPPPKNTCRKPKFLLARSSKSKRKHQPAICFPA